MNHMIDLFLLSATAVNRKLEAVENVSMQDSVAAVLRRYPFSSTEAARRSSRSTCGPTSQFAGQSELARWCC
jgi:two-component system CAI-1 autoinducer sensor kinase/phosphatase CqsS